ncbi:MAG: M48 family metallopeptidase [Nitrospirae bacterium]|nr:M48 family metallopeptidase [Nitrospirota bacterium]
MRYTPKEPRENVNIVRTSLLKEFFLLAGGILTITVIVYTALGLAVDLVVPRLSPGIEQRLGGMYSGMYADTGDREAEKRIQRILDGLTSVQPEERGWRYRVHLVENTTVNALALPGGRIVIFSGLLDVVDSENELAFVLAHELGHFAHRDHLRGLGRRLVLLAMVTAVFGQESSASRFIYGSLMDVEMKFSQRQEEAADLWAVDLMNRRYGHVGGAVDFLEAIARKEKRSRFAYFFSTHPHPSRRVKVLKEYIIDKGYRVRESIPLNGL